MGNGNAGMRGTLALLLALVGSACGYKASVGAIHEDAAVDAAEPDAAPPVDAGVVAREDAGVPGTCVPSPDPAPLRHLTRVEVRNALAELVGAVPASASALPADERVAGYEAGAMVNVAFVEAMHTVAVDVGAQVGSAITTFVPCLPDSDVRDCAEAFVRSFGRRAWRRPVSEREVERLLALYDGGADHVVGVRRVVEALLESPYFLYRPERGAPSGAGRSALTDHEVAARLAAFLWRGIPDETLGRAADRGELRTDAQVEAQARRMLADPRAESGVLRFAQQWLRYEGITERDGADLSDALEAALLEETDAFVSHVVLSGDRRFDTLLASPFTFGNDTLAAYYGVTPPGTSELVRIPLPPAERASVLTHGSILALHQTPTLRGLLIRTQLLCQEVPPPPPDITAPIDDTEPGTRRERYEASNLSDAVCAGCHRLIDPIGFALETYGSDGRYRTVDNGYPIDDTGSIETAGDASGTVMGGPDLAMHLAASSFVHACFVTQWARFALRRPETEEDRCMLGRVTDTFTSAGLDIQELLVAIATSEGFRHRTAPAPVGTLPPDASPTSPLDQAEHDLRVLIAGHAAADRVLLEVHLSAIRSLRARLGT